MAVAATSELAIAVASTSLHDASRADPGAAAASAATRSAILKYLIRMSTRPTPFGLFADVAMGRAGDDTSLFLDTGGRSTRTQCAMPLLGAIVDALEQDDAVFQRLTLLADPACRIFAGRLRLSGVSGPAAVSVRATEPVAICVSAARHPISTPDLVGAIRRELPDAPEARILGLIRHLWRHGFLLTDLRPPFTCDDPSAYLLGRLSDIPIAAATRRLLADFIARLARWDAIELERRDADSYRSLLSQVSRLASCRDSDALRIDCSRQLGGGGRVSRTILEESAKAAELLLRVSSAPHGPAHLAAYRTAFEERYGRHGEVPVLELLDESRGLGPLSHFRTAAAQTHWLTARRDRALLRLAGRALHLGQLSVELTEGDLKELETWKPDLATAPRGLDLYVSIAAASLPDVNAGRYKLVVGPNVGAGGAGRNVGRFAGMLDQASELAAEIARQEQQAAPDTLFAELVFHPESRRLANVVLRPAVRAWEVGVVSAGRSGSSQVIPLDEIVVCVSQGRFGLRWKRLPAGTGHIVLSRGHMLNAMGNPGLYGFLAEVGCDGFPQFTGFDWGPAHSLPVLPRVTVGRLVLSLARWRIDSSVQAAELRATAASPFQDQLLRWRAQWHVPDHVYASTAAADQPDHRLLLDLRCGDHVEELRKAVSRLRDGDRVVLEEALPGLHDAWVMGPRGRHLMEMVVSLRPRASRDGVATATGVTSDTSREAALHGLANVPTSAAVGVAPGGAYEGVQPPGSECLYAHLYCDVESEDDIIAGPMMSFVDSEVQKGNVRAWMFLRYADKSAHIRLRLWGRPSRLLHRVLPALVAWTTAMRARDLLMRFSLETYEREMVRYGGSEGVVQAEALFAADSRAVAILLGLLSRGELEVDRMELAVLTILDLLASLGLRADEIWDWSRQYVRSGREAAPLYKERQVRLLTMLAAPGNVLGTAAEDTLRRRRSELEIVGRRLRALRDRAVLTKTMGELCSSFVHMHCNRLLGRDQQVEHNVLGLVARACESRRRLAVSAPSRVAGAE